MNNQLILRDRNGEFGYNPLETHIPKKYKPDTPLDRSFIPYLILLFCSAVDATVFIDLFSLISYDSTFMLAIGVGGLLFAFDFVPVYIGIQLRRQMQGLSKDKFILWLALSGFIVAFILNVVLRLTTIDLMIPDLSSASTSFFGTVSQEAENKTVDPTVISQTLFGITLPLLTSIGSFFISYLTYNPLQKRKRNSEELLVQMNDEIRRLDAILSEYEAYSVYENHLQQDDNEKYKKMQTYQAALVTGYCDYVRQALKEHLAKPDANTELSNENNDGELLRRLEQELKLLDSFEVPVDETFDEKTANLVVL